MSLLMEALRKAEEAKRKIQTQNPDTSRDFSSASVNQADITPAPVLTATPDPDFTMIELDSEANSDFIIDNFLRTPAAESAVTKPESAPFAARKKTSRASFEELQNYLETTPEAEEAAATLRSNTPVKPLPDVQQRAAGAVFAAKQKPVQSHATRNILLVVLALLIPIGATVLWYLANAGGSSLIVDPALLAGNGASRSLSDELFNPQAAPVAQNPAPITTVPMQQQNPIPIPGNATANAPPATALQEPEIAAGTNSTSAERPSEAPSAVHASAVAAIQQQTSDVAPTSLPAAAESLVSNDAEEIGAVLEVSHSAATNRNNQQLLDAYASLQAGDLNAATMLYQQVLQQLPNNRDALLGNAAIAMRQGDLLQAREFYSRLMQLNPRDPLARTGLLQTVQGIDQGQHEQELQRLLQQYPDVAPLSFALGNIYASQQRWNEAQSAYFDAFLFARQSNEGALNPDYAYNLAVSLEQLNQPKAALDYYRQAHTLSGTVSPGFDTQELSRRISFLERNNP